MRTTPLGYGLLGPLLLTIGGMPAPLGTPKQRAVLATLLVNRNRVVSADALIDAAWNDDPVPAARASLHTYVSNLRRLLAGTGPDAHTLLAAAPPGYRLGVADGECDVDRFGVAMSSGIHAAARGQFEQASSHLADALAEWRGPVLDDLREFSFVEPLAAALEEDRVLVQTTHAECEIACGRAHAVINVLEALVAEHPYREPVWAQLITAYYVASRQSDALDAYRRLRAELVDGLGIDPSPALAAVHDRVLRQEPLPIKRSAKTTAIDAARTIRPPANHPTAAAGLRNASGQLLALQPTITRIGRLADNDIVLDDDAVSRRHAVIVDTGSQFVITDARSANGVKVQGSRLAPSAVLADGDEIRIGAHRFTFVLGG